MNFNRVLFNVNTALMLKGVHSGSVLLPDSFSATACCRVFEAQSNSYSVYVLTPDPNADTETNQESGAEVIHRLNEITSGSSPAVAVISDDAPMLTVFTSAFKQSSLFQEIKAAQAREQEYRSKMSRYQELVDKEFLAKYVPRYAGTFSQTDQIEQDEAARWLNEYEQHYYNGVPFSKKI